MKYLLLCLLLVSNMGACCLESDQALFIGEYIRKINKKAPAEAIAAAIITSGAIHRVDPLLIVAQMEIESTFNPLANGASEERGLMQIHPKTAKDLRLPWGNAYDILLNVEAGTRYLSSHLQRYGDVERALSRYNGKGPKSVAYAARVKARYLKIVWSKL